MGSNESLTNPRTKVVYEICWERYAAIAKKEMKQWNIIQKQNKTNTTLKKLLVLEMQYNWIK